MSAPLRAIVVDDEPPARREMRRLLELHSEVLVVGEADDVRTAQGLLERTRPDVVFLDIKLGEGSGFDLLAHLDPETAVVFVTAYHAYAVQAFTSAAVDYLLKPIEPERLRDSIERLVSRVAEHRASSPPARADVFTAGRWVLLEADGRPEFVSLETIACIQAEGKRTVVHTIDGVSRQALTSLQDWETRLPPGDFLRVHRGTIVNLRHVERIESWSNYGYRIHLKGGGPPIAMSRRYASKARDLLR